MLPPGPAAVCSRKGGRHLQRVLSPLASMSEPSAFLSSMPHLPLRGLLSFLPGPLPKALPCPSPQESGCCFVIGQSDPTLAAQGPWGWGFEGAAFWVRLPLHGLHGYMTLCWLLAPEPWRASFKSRG